MTLSAPASSAPAPAPVPAPVPAPARVRPTIVTRMLLALAGLVLLLAGLGALSVWGVQRAEAELRRAEQSLAQLENARAVEAAFNSYLLVELDRRLRGGGDPAESREAGQVRGALVTYRRLIGAEISTSDSQAERAAERAELLRANALADIFETVETRSILDRIAGRHFAAGRAARAFQDEVVQGQDLAFRALVSEVVEDERAESLSALGTLQDLRADLAIAWTALAVLFLTAGAGFGVAFYRGLMRPDQGVDGRRRGRRRRDRCRGRERGCAAADTRPAAGRVPAGRRPLQRHVGPHRQRAAAPARRGRRAHGRAAGRQRAPRRYRQPHAGVSSPISATSCARPSRCCSARHRWRCGQDGQDGRGGRNAGSGEREALERIAASGGMLRRRLDDLMRLARSEEGELTLELGPCDLGEAVRGAVEAARAYAATNEVDLVFEDGPGCRVNGDPEALRQAALALIDNSIKLSEPGSAVHVRLRARGFEVADSGPGFEGCDPALLFERYVQESPGRRAGGSGLGLAIVKWIADQHGARIHAEERPGCGAIFRMEFA